MKYSIRLLLIAMVFGSIAAYLIAAEFRSSARMRNEDAQIITAVLVCDYLDANQNQWPTDWNKLEQFFNTRYPNGNDLSFDDIQTEVSVDFKIDGTKLLETCVSRTMSAKFRPIESKRTNLESRAANPNSMVLNHVGRMITY